MADKKLPERGWQSGENRCKKVYDGKQCMGRVLYEITSEGPWAIRPTVGVCLKCGVAHAIGITRAVEGESCSVGAIPIDDAAAD